MISGIACCCWRHVWFLRSCMIAVEMSRGFDSIRRFDGILYKDDLELFRFVMICKFTLIF